MTTMFDNQNPSAVYGKNTSSSGGNGKKNNNHNKNKANFKNSVYSSGSSSGSGNSSSGHSGGSSGGNSGHNSGHVVGNSGHNFRQSSGSFDWSTVECQGCKRTWHYASRCYYRYQPDRNSISSVQRAFAGIEISPT